MYSVRTISRSISPKCFLALKSGGDLLVVALSNIVHTFVANEVKNKLPLIQFSYRWPFTGFHIMANSRDSRWKWTCPFWLECNKNPTVRLRIHWTLCGAASAVRPQRISECHLEPFFNFHIQHLSIVHGAFGLSVGGPRRNNWKNEMLCKRCRLRRRWKQKSWTQIEMP